MTIRRGIMHISVDGLKVQIIISGVIVSYPKEKTAYFLPIILKRRGEERYTHTTMI